MVSESLSIYLCDDVYRTEDTATHGSGTISVPIAAGEYKIFESKLLLCNDGCNHADVVSRAAQGYTPAYHAVQSDEYAVSDGWNYHTRRFSMEIPEAMLEELQNQGVLEKLTAQLEREYYYLLTLDDTHYAYIAIFPKDENTTKPTDEDVIVNEFIKNAKIEFTSNTENYDEQTDQSSDSDKGVDQYTSSDLYNRTTKFLEQEFYRVYERHYDIQSLTVSGWNEHGNEATFFYKMTYLHYNRDPDTVGYIHEAKKQSQQMYERMCNDYLALKEGNYEFKIILNDENLELYTNVSHKDVVWEPIKIDDYILGS